MSRLSPPNRARRSFDSLSVDEFRENEQVSWAKGWGNNERRQRTVTMMSEVLFSEKALISGTRQQGVR